MGINKFDNAEVNKFNNVEMHLKTGLERKNKFTIVSTEIISS